MLFWGVCGVLLGVIRRRGWCRRDGNSFCEIWVRNEKTEGEKNEKTKNANKTEKIGVKKKKKKKKKF